MNHNSLESRGHKVIDIRSTIYEGSDDLFIFDMAQKQHAIFLTTDKDFFHTIPNLYAQHYGIIVIAVRQPNRRSIVNKLLFALNHFDLSQFNSKVLILRDNSYSIYGDD
ncbi:DUF5615 family PIN-like protein [candidate division KSB1 bacterium]|nr:DUF5615 family PIN-like protein [candidate division KSB1 bacterium]